MGARKTAEHILYLCEAAFVCRFKIVGKASPSPQVILTPDEVLEFFDLSSL